MSPGHPLFYLPYREAYLWQKELHARRVAGRIPDCLMLVEHDPVITLGTRTREEHLLTTPEELRGRGIQLVETDRGGSVTYHGQGQLVAYPIFYLWPEERDLHLFLRQLEEAVIRTLAGFGVQAFRREGKTGVFTAKGKICSIGVMFRRWVSYHGLALNVNPDLSHFRLIVPCGLWDVSVTSLAQFPLPTPSLNLVAGKLVKEVRRVFSRNFLVLYGGSFSRLAARSAH